MYIFRSTGRGIHKKKNNAQNESPIQNKLSNLRCKRVKIISSLSEAAKRVEKLRESVRVMLGATENEKKN